MKTDRFKAVRGNSAIMDVVLREPVDTQSLVSLLNASYTIPNWCRMHPLYHFDGMGGCWSIASGNVIATGGKCCEKCEFKGGL